MYQGTPTGEKFNTVESSVEWYLCKKVTSLMQQSNSKKSLINYLGLEMHI